MAERRAERQFHQDVERGDLDGVDPDGVDRGPLQRTLLLLSRLMDERVGEGFVRRAWIFVHGGKVSAFLTFLLAIQCLLDAFAVRKTPRGTICAVNGTVLFIGWYSQVCRARDRVRVKRLLADLTDLTARLETRIPPEESNRIVTLLSLGCWALALDAFVSALFVLSAPPFTSHLPFGHILCLAGKLDCGYQGDMPRDGGLLTVLASFFIQYVAQSMAFIVSCFCAMELQAVHGAFSIITAALLRCLAHGVKLAQNRAQLHPVLEEHRAVLQVLQSFVKVFERQNFVRHMAALSMMLFTTVAIIGGNRELYVLALYPFPFVYITAMALQSDLLQAAQEKMLNSAYEGAWADMMFMCDCPQRGVRCRLPCPGAEALAFKKAIFTLMIRATHPVGIRNRWMGPLSLPSLRHTLSGWYRFTKLYSQVA